MIALVVLLLIGWFLIINAIWLPFTNKGEMDVYCGELEVGEGAWIGTGTTVIQGIHIGK